MLKKIKLVAHTLIKIQFKQERIDEVVVRLVIFYHKHF